MDDYVEFCISAYSREFGVAMSRSGRENGEQACQKQAIQRTMLAAMEQFPNVESGQLWRAIETAHVQRKSGIVADKETIDRVVSASQSWRKSSGHAFEEMIANVVNASLEQEGIQVLLQRDLTTLMSNGQIDNKANDRDFLEEARRAAMFDLYISLVADGERLVYGCIQSKTSIRDRITRDREFSMAAMDRFFWSTAVVLDGSFLTEGDGKFRYAVKGGSTEFHDNGWHGMYVLSQRYVDERIYPTGRTFDTFIAHAKIAAMSWRYQRQWMDKDWRVETAVTN